MIVVDRYAIDVFRETKGPPSAARRKRAHYDVRMKPAINPYVSPAAIEAERIQRVRNELMYRLRGPSIGLLVLAGLQLVAACLALPQMVMHVVDGREPSPLIVTMGCLLPSAFIGFAAWRMRHMRSLGLCRLGAILGCIPLLSPVYVLGIPFGIWAVIVLYMPSTAAAFDQPAVVRADLAE